MRCFTQGCNKEGTQPDYETPSIFINPEDPDGAPVRPAHCPEHHAELMASRDENEASWDRIMRGR